jgi:uncharacterized membrane protein
MEFIKIYITAFLSFLAIDAVWLGVIAPRFYRKYIGHLMAENANLFAAGLFYVLFIAGLTMFVIQPAIKEASWLVALTRGAFFGLVTYATFDLTNQAVLKNWPWTVTLVDMLWGTVLAASVALTSYAIFNAVFK